MLFSCIVMSSTLPYIKLIFAVPLTLMKLKRAPMKEMKSRDPWGQLSIPPHLSPLRDSVRWSATQREPHVFIYSVVSDLRGLPVGPDKPFNRPAQHGFVLPSTTSVCHGTACVCQCLKEGFWRGVGTKGPQECVLMEGEGDICCDHGKRKMDNETRCHVRVWQLTSVQSEVLLL